LELRVPTTLMVAGLGPAPCKLHLEGIAELPQLLRRPRVLDVSVRVVRRWFLARP